MADTKQILTEMSHDNPCNYLELSRGHIDFSDALNSALKAGKEYHRLLYDVGYFYPLREEYEEDKAETLQRINTSHTMKKDDSMDEAEQYYSDLEDAAHE